MKLKITVENQTYEVDVELEDEAAQNSVPYARNSRPVPESSVATPAEAAAEDSATVSSDKVCRSPIVGTVVEVLVQPGDEVKLDQPLMVLEAMKMETGITSPADSVVKQILVEAGDSVQAGQVLIEFAE